MVKFIRLLSLFFLFSIAYLSAQTISVSASTDTSAYKVGDYIRYQIEIKHDKGIVVYLPPVKDSVKTLEFINALPSEKNEVNNIVTERFHYIFSKYDSAKVTIPPLPIGYTEWNSSVKKYINTNPVVITVRTLQVNQQEDIRDVKEPVKFPLNWLLIGLIMLAIIILGLTGFFLYKYYKKKKQQKGITAPEVIIPPHEIALNKLAELENKKLWQNGFVKEFHSEVTQIVREYFEARFNFRALELTSSEIFGVLSFLEEGKSVLSVSEKFFSNADLVKFAKFEPMPRVNEEMMSQAYEIVRSTIPAEKPKTESGTENVQ